MSFEQIEEKITATPSYPTSIAIINPPNRISSLCISLAPNKDTGNLTVGDLIARVKACYPTLGLVNDFPVEKITIMAGNIPYDIQNNVTVLSNNGKIPHLRIMFPSKIEARYLKKNAPEDESSSLTGRQNKSLFSRLFG